MAETVLRVGNETRINTTTTGTQDFQMLLPLSDGRYAVVWSGNGTQTGQVDNAGVFQQLFDAQGNRIGGEIRVNSTTEGSQGQAFWALPLTGGRWAPLWVSPSGKDIHMQIFDSSGQIGSETSVNTTPEGINLLSVRNRVLADGSHALVWLGTGSQPGQEDADGGVFLQHIGANGVKIGSEIRVNTTLTGNPNSMFATAHADGFVVVWAGAGAQTGQEDSAGIFMQRFDHNLNRLGSETRVNADIAARSEHTPFVRALPDGGWVVTYLTGSTTTGLVVWQQAFDNAGLPRGGEVQLSALTGPGFSANIDVLPLEDGRWATFWQEGASAATRDIYCQVFNADGTAAGAKTLATQSTADLQLRLFRQPHSDGGFVMLWEGRGTQAGQQDADRGIFLQRFDANGIKVGDEIRVNTTTAGEQLAFRFVQLPSGHYVVLWQGPGTQPGQEDTIGTYQQVFDANLNRVGGETRVATSVDGIQWNPNIVVLTNSSWAVIWEGNGTQTGHEDADDGTGNSGGVFQQRFRLQIDPTSVEVGGQTTLTIAENGDAGRDIGALSVDDLSWGETYSYAILGETPFDIAPDGSGGFKLKLKSGVTLNREDYTAGTFTFQVRVNDSGGGTFTQTITVNVTDVNEAPPADIKVDGQTSLSLTENSSAGHDFGLISSTDADTGQSVVYRLVDASGNEDTTTPFEIVASAAGYRLKLKDGVTLNREDYTNGVAIVRIAAIDSGSPARFRIADIAITVGDVNEFDPADIKVGGATTITVMENGEAGRDIGLLSGTDGDRQSLTYAIVDTNGDPITHDLFEIAPEGAGSKLKLKSGVTLNYEGAAGPSLTFKIKATDNGDPARSTVQDITVNIGDLNNETFTGSTGIDTLVGTAGDDFIFGKGGKDVMTGGAGKDIFVFDAAPVRRNPATITDFNVTDDTLHISLAALNLKLKAGALSSKNFSNKGRPLDKNDFFYYSKKSGTVFFDADGNGTRKRPVEIAKLDKNLDLTAADFFLI